MNNNFHLHLPSCGSGWVRKFILTQRGPVHVAKEWGERSKESESEALEETKNKNTLVTGLSRQIPDETSSTRSLKRLYHGEQAVNAGAEESLSTGSWLLIRDRWDEILLSPAGEGWVWGKAKPSWQEPQQNRKCIQKIKAHENQTSPRALQMYDLVSDD